MSYHHQERLYDFTGGLNNRDANALLQNNETPEMCNVVLGKKGTLETRPGTAYFRDAPVENEESVTSIFEYVRSGDAYILAFAGGKLKRASQLGWDEVTCEDEDLTLTPDSYLEFAVNPVIDKAAFVNGEDGYFETDGEEFAEVEPYEPDEDELTEVGDCVIPEKPKLICYHKSRTWLANMPDYPDRVYYTVDDIVGNPLYNYFTATGFLRMLNPKGEGITAMISFKERLYIFTKTTIRVIAGDDIDEFAAVELSRSVGAVSQRGVCTFGDYIIFEAVDGVYLFDGISAPMKISVRIPATMEKVATSYKHLSCGAIHQGKYYLSVPESTVNDVTLVYDTEVIPLTYIGEKHSFANSPWVLHRGYTPTQWLVSQDANLYFASDDGYVYQYGVGDTDVGEMIKVSYSTKLLDLDMADRAKRVRRLTLDARQEKDSYLRIDYRVDNEEGKWRMFRREVDLSEPIDRMFLYFPDGRGPLCRKIAFRFSTVYAGSRFRINGFTLDMAIRGHQEERGG